MLKKVLFLILLLFFSTSMAFAQTQRPPMHMQIGPYDISELLLVGTLTCTEENLSSSVYGNFKATAAIVVFENRVPLIAVVVSEENGAEFFLYTVDDTWKAIPHEEISDSPTRIQTTENIRKCRKKMALD